MVVAESIGGTRAVISALGYASLISGLEAEALCVFSEKSLLTVHFPLEFFIVESEAQIFLSDLGVIAVLSSKSLAKRLHHNGLFEDLFHRKVGGRTK